MSGRLASDDACASTAGTKEPMTGRDNPAGSPAGRRRAGDARYRTARHATASAAIHEQAATPGAGRILGSPLVHDVVRRGADLRDRRSRDLGWRTLTDPRARGSRHESAIRVASAG